MGPEEAASAREQHAATTRAYHARRGVLQARNAAVMAVEGYTGIRVATYDHKAHGEAVFWRPTAKIDEPLQYERMAVTRSSKPTWSRYHSLYGPGDNFVTAGPDNIIYVRPK